MAHAYKYEYYNDYEGNKLEQSIQTDNLEIFQKLYEKYDYVRGMMAWKRAVAEESLEIINYLYKMEPENLNYHDGDGITLLYRATITGNINSFKLLIDLGANENIEFNNGMWPCVYGNNIYSVADAYMNVEMCEYLELKRKMIKSSNKV